MLPPEVAHLNRFVRAIVVIALFVTLAGTGNAQPSLRHKLGQMVMVTFTGDSLNKSSASIDTLKADLAEGNIGGVILFTWSSNLRSPGQILQLTQDLQRRSSISLLIATDQEGGSVARLGPSNGFTSTPSEYQLGAVNAESNTRNAAATMAGWLAQTGITVNLAPVVDVNVNPNSPAIGKLNRSFSADPEIVANNASWFIDEFHRQWIYTTLKHFPGHGSATSDSHLGLTDVTSTWSDTELIPYRRLLAAGMVDLIMTAHVFNGKLDSLYPATLSHNILTGLLRNDLGFRGVVVSDDMNMKAIVNYYGFDEAVVLAVNAGMDMLLYTTNLDTAGGSLARHVVDLLERKVHDGTISAARIDESYARIMALKQQYLTSVQSISLSGVPKDFILANFPNPFNASTRISIQVPIRTHVSLKIFDLLGREVANLLEGEIPAGTQVLSWNAALSPSGMYIAQLRTNRQVRNIKMILLK